MRGLKLIPVATLGAALLASCGGSSSTTSATSPSTTAAKAPYTVGMIDATTGIYGPVGVDELDGAKLAISQINSSGGVNGHQLKLSIVDDQGSVSLSTVGFKKLAVEDSIPVILGPGITPPAEADAPLAQQYKAVELNLVAQPVTWQGRPYVFSMVTSQTVLADAMMKYMATVNHVTKVQILYANVPFSAAGMKELTAAAQKYGVTILGTNSWDVTKFNFTSQASQVASSNPPGLFLWGAGTPSDAQILKSVVAQGYKGKIVGDITYAEGNIPKVAGNAAASAVVGISQLNYAQPNAQTSAFLDSFKTQYQRPADYLSAAAYDSIYILKKAIEKAGTYNATAIAKAMNGLSYQGTNGAYSFSASYRGGPNGDSYVPITFDSTGAYKLAPTS